MEEDEPDKMAIAVQRIGRLKRFIIRVIKGFFCGIKGALCFIFRCGKARVRETDMDLDILADKEFQVRSRSTVHFGRRLCLCSTRRVMKDRVRYNKIKIIKIPSHISHPPDLTQS